MERKNATVIVKDSESDQDTEEDEGDYAQNKHNDQFNASVDQAAEQETAMAFEKIDTVKQSNVANSRRNTKKPDNSGTVTTSTLP